LSRGRFWVLRPSPSPNSFKKKRLDESILEDIDTYDEISEELSDDDTDADIEAPVDPAKLTAEIAELRSYKELALSIGSNAKGEKLVEKLPEILGEIVKLGGREKAVIFTESVRTQKYLAEVLGANGYDRRVVLLNGQNNDAESKMLYADWMKRHAGTDAISGSKSADMKAAIVDAFKGDDKTILIATESGAEGINLQFCSLIVNFDLPWNPQRVEQRIGRCHRYGQKIDVMVVNLLNRKNQAERRVYELLDKKFKLFEGVFGASDEVLGAIERGVDFERKVLEIFQEARSDEEVQRAFDQLQEEMEDTIKAEILDARTKLMENMDQDVVSKLKTRKGMIETTMNEFERRLALIARAELPEAKFHGSDSPRFDYQGKTYTTEWPLADENGWQFFRLADGNLAQHVVDQAAYPNQLMDVAALVGKSGWMKVSKITVSTPQSDREELIAACVADDGTEVHPETVDRMFYVPAQSEEAYSAEALPEALGELEATLKTNIISGVQEQNAIWLDAETDKLDAYADDLEKAAEAEIKELDDEIKAARKQLRSNTSLPMDEKLKEKRRIKRLEDKRDDMKLETFERRKNIRREVNDMLDDIANSLEAEPVITPVLTIRWEVAA